MFRFLNRYWSKPAVISLVVEVLILAAAVWLGYHLRFPGRYGFFTSDWVILARASTFAVVVLLTSYLVGLYDFPRFLTAGEQGIRLLRALTLSALGLGAVYYAIPFLFLGRGLLAISFVAAGVGLGCWRLLLFWLLRRKFFSERILIVGADKASKDLAKEILSRSHLGYEVVGFLSDAPEFQGKSLINPRVIGTSSDVCEVALANQATRVVVAQEERRGKLDLDALLRCKTKGIPVEQGKTYYEQITGRVALDSPRIRSWLIFNRGFVVSPTTLFVKRIVDISVAVLILAASVPVIVLVALAIWLDSGRPILYRQERLGRDGQPFVLWKFRSMRTDAEKVGSAQWAVRNDPRITRVGRWIRKTRIDEIPQLWNILVGDMSLVGPRPEREEFVEKLIEHCPIYKQRLVVRPGLTGWAQIQAPYAATIEESIEKLQYDLYYSRNISVFLDLSILASTLRTVLLGRGAQ